MWADILKAFQSPVADWIAGIGSVATFLVILLAWRQLVADHERSRRQNTVDILMEFSRTLSGKFSSAAHIVFLLGPPEVKNLYDNNPISIPESAKHYLESILETAVPDERVKNNSIALDSNETQKIRQEVSSYLNMLESVLSGWHLGVVDRPTIEREFSYLGATEKGQFLLQNYRDAAGGTNSFPAIQLFSDHLKTPKDQQREPLGKKSFWGTLFRG